MQLFQDFVLCALGNNNFLAVFEHYFISLFVSIYRESVLDVFVALAGWSFGSFEKSALFLSSVMTNLYASFCFLYMLFRLSGSAVRDLKHFMAVSTLKLSSAGPNTSHETCVF